MPKVFDTIQATVMPTIRSSIENFNAIDQLYFNELTFPITLE